MTGEQEALLKRVEMKLDLLLSGTVATPGSTVPAQLFTGSKASAISSEQNVKQALSRYLGKNFVNFLK